MEIQKTEGAINPELVDLIETNKQNQQEDEAKVCPENRDEDEDELQSLLLSDIGELPLTPPSATQLNFVSYFITDFTKPGHDQFIYRHANGVYSNALIVQNAMRSESITALCKVSTANDSYIVRCCVKGSLLEVNERLIKQPQLLNSSADREGYIAIIMSRPADWTKNKESLITLEEYEEKKQVSL